MTANFNPTELQRKIAEIEGVKDALQRLIAECDAIKEMCIDAKSYADLAIATAKNLDARLALLEKYLPAIEKSYAGTIAPEASLDAVLAHVCTRNDNGPCTICGAELPRPIIGVNHA